MNIRMKSGRNSKLGFVFVTLLTIVAIIALGCGTTDTKETELAIDSQAVETIHQEGDEHDNGVPLHEENAGNHDVESIHEGVHEAEEGDLLEITLNAVEGRPWHFEPSILEFAVGQRVKLTLVNGGRVEHDVEIAGVPAEDIEILGGAENHERLGRGHHLEGVVAAHAEPGTTTTVLFTPTQTGEYEFECTIPGHREAGMVGKVIVTPGS